MTPSAAASNATGMDMDPSKMAEHRAVSKLVSGSETHVAKQSGSWFDPNTWQGSRIPDANAKVLISKGTSVTYDDRSDARLFTLNVEGELKFATNKNTKMVVDTFVVSEEGNLEIGTEKNPVKAGVKTEIWIADNGKINRSWDPTQVSRGLIAKGKVSIHGQEKVSHLKVAKDPMAGDNSLVLEGKPTNWQVGDRLVLTGTRFIADTQGKTWDEATEDEEVTIKAIEGNKVILDQTLKFNHNTPRGDLKAYVANQSRNIVIGTENADQLPNGQRGHVMFMHNNDVDVRYAEFKDLGRTDKSKRVDNFKDTGGVYPQRVLDGQGNPVPGAQDNITGRYSIHFHKTGASDKPAVLVGNSIDGSPGWGAVLHDSSGIFEKNVAYNIGGGAFVSEVGNETGAFRDNISIKTGPPQDLGVIEKQGTGTHDFARTGVGFWFQGRLVENENNVAASSRNAGIFYFHRGVDLEPVDINNLPVPDLAKDFQKDGFVNVDQAPIQNFKNNEVFASGNALHVIKDFPKQTHDLRTVMDGLKGWEVEMGNKLQYTSHYTMNNFDLIGSKEATNWKNKGLALQKNVQDMVWNDMSVVGFDKGISVDPDTGLGPTALQDRGLTWVDLKMDKNTADFENFSLPPEKWLTKQDLKPGSLRFDLSNDSDFMVSGSDVGNYIDIRGTKTDSLGTIEMPFGDESLGYNYQGTAALAQKGYYELPDGSRGAIIEEYFSDRVTGETIKYPFVVKFNEDWWTDGAPFLGKLDPNTIGGPEKVNLPDSRFRLNQGPIQEVDPITPATPEAPDPINPNPGNPNTPDPVAPDPTAPEGEDPTDPINQGPGTPPDSEKPGPAQPTPNPTEDPTERSPLQPSDTLKPSLGMLQPVAAYSLDTGSGATAKDTSTAGKDNVGDLWDGVMWTEGVDGSGLVMDGTGSVRVGNSRDINLGKHKERSLSMWFKADNTTDKKQVLYEEGGSDRGLNAYINEDGLLYVGGWNQPQSQSGWDGSFTASDKQVTDGQWHHVAVVLRGGEAVTDGALTTYLDGEEVDSAEGSQLWSHSGRIALGNIAGVTRFHDGVGRGSQGLVGSLDEAYVFNQALDSQQVKTLATQF